MEGLREEVGKGDLIDHVARSATRIDEHLQIARKRCGIARDVNDFGCGNFREQRSGFGAQTGARRIDNNQVGNNQTGPFA